VKVAVRPNGVTDIECPKGPRQNVGTPDERRVTHHLVGQAQRCCYCRQVRSTIAATAGLE
jgi:hypothetical protein